MTREFTLHRNSQYTDLNAIVKLQVAMGTKEGKMLLTTAPWKAAAWYCTGAKPGQNRS